MKKFFICTIFLTLVTWGCGTKKVIPTAQKINQNLKIKELLLNHNATKPQFESLVGSIYISFNNQEQSQSFTFSLRMKMGEAIWLSAPLGLAKIYLTPEKVQFYSKMDHTFFEGDYSLIKHFLGIELDFQSVENLLLGQILLEESYDMIPRKEGYLCTYQNKSIGSKILIDSNYRLKYVNTFFAERDLDFEMNYTYQTIENQLFPNYIRINTSSYQSKNTTIELELNNVELNVQVKFPYRVPNGYKPLNINIL